MLTRLGASADSEQQLQWMASDEHTHGEALQWSAQGAIPAVPEPANVAMLLAGLAVVAGVAVRKRSQP